jgi:hypothetical protein
MKLSLKGTENSLESSANKLRFFSKQALKTAEVTVIFIE